MMANPHRGEVAIEVEGESYTLRYTVNAVARVENSFGGMPWHKVIGKVFDVENALTEDLIRLFRGGLWHHHRDLTEEDAGDLMESMGMAETAKVVIQALGLATPEPKEGNKTVRPRKAGG